MNKFIAAAIFGVSLGGNAFANDFGPYVEAAVGSTKFKVDASAGWVVKDTDTSFSIVGGYMLNPNIGVEGGYLSLGKASVSANGAFNGSVNGKSLIVTSAAVNADAAATGYVLGLRGVLPVNDQFSVSGRVGLYNWSVATKLSVSAAGTYGGTAFSGATSFSDTYTGSDAYFGIGANYKIDKNKSIGAAYTTYRLGGDIKTDATNLDVHFIVNF